MKTLVIIFAFLFGQVAMAKKENSALDFYIKEGKKAEKVFTYNKYEYLIGGGLGFIIGNIGYFTTESKTLKLSYSGVQTIGIINVGQGIYKINRPILEKEIYNTVMSSEKKLSKEDLAMGMVKAFAQEERAKRLAMMYGSGLLMTQYLINTFIGETQDDLKDIYSFLAGVNAIIFGYTLLSKDKYEQFYYEKVKRKSNVQVTPVMFKTTESSYGGVLGIFTF